MSFDDFLVVSVGGCVAALVALVVFQTLGSVVLMAVVVTSALSTIVRHGHIAPSKREPGTPRNP